MNKKKIALIVDVENWAFDIEAKILKKHLSCYYDIDIYISKDYDDDLFRILEDTKQYDIIHFFWRKLLLQMFSEEVIGHFLYKEDYYEYLSFLRNKISTGIYDHLFLEKQEIAKYQPLFQNYCKKYYTCSKKLEEIYKQIEEYPNPWGTIHDTYDNLLYDGGDKRRFETRNRKEFVVGWVGNSNWNIKYRDFKGFHSVLNPAIDELIEEGYSIERNFADKNIYFRSNEEMPSYYQEIDVCVIASTEEGTPRPVLEAMASGVPIISTDVGIVMESFGPKQKEFILGTRNGENDLEIKELLKTKLKELYNNRPLLKELSEENYLYSRQNNIENLLTLYKQYFDEF